MIRSILGAWLWVSVYLGGTNDDTLCFGITVSLYFLSSPGWKNTIKKSDLGFYLHHIATKGTWSNYTLDICIKGWNFLFYF
jgi:hypothetical protein